MTIMAMMTMMTEMIMVINIKMGMIMKKSNIDFIKCKSNKFCFNGRTKIFH